MFIKSERQKVLELEKSFDIVFIALWDTIENAKSYYDNENGFYIAYIESKENLEYAYATPVRVFKSLNLSLTL